MCRIAAVSIEATSKRIEQAVENMLEVLRVNYEKVKEGSRPKPRPGCPVGSSPEEVWAYRIFNSWCTLEIKSRIGRLFYS